MATTIQADMQQAGRIVAAMFGKAARQEFIVALNDYGETGEHPAAYEEFVATGELPKGAPKWLPTYATCWERIDMSEAARERSRAMNDAKRRKRERKDAPRGGTTGSDHVDAPCGGSCVEGSSGEVSSGEQRCARMAEPEEGKVFLDSEDGVHQTRRDALVTTYRVRTGRDDYDRFASKALDGRCAGCDGSRAGECFECLRAALMAWDGSKAKTPVPLAKKMLGEEVFA